MTFHTTVRKKIYTIHQSISYTFLILDYSMHPVILPPTHCLEQPPIAHHDDAIAPSVPLSSRLVEIKSHVDARFEWWRTRQRVTSDKCPRTTSDPFVVIRWSTQLPPQLVIWSWLLHPHRRRLLSHVFEIHTKPSNILLLRWTSGQHCLPSQ